MGFQVEVVKECPVTRGSSGVMTMTTEHIAMIAGAVRDKIEWMVLLHGTRSEDGYEVKVDRFTVPLQYRDGTEVELAQDITLPADCVGVMHSHHSMGAFFSSTDRNELNPRFPSSIVVAIAYNNLGFNFEICGKVKLPCGALGMVDFDLVVEGVERFAAEPVKGQHDPEAVADLKAKDGGLTGCTHRQYINHPDDQYLAVDSSACGITTGEVIQRPLVFGMDGTDLLAAVAQQTRKPVDNRLPVHYQGNSNGAGRGSGYRAGETYWERRKREHQAAQSALDQAKGKGRKGKKGKGGCRNGLVKLDRPPKSASVTSVVGNCDDCGWKALLQWIAEWREWLCDDCIQERAEELLAGTNSNDDRTVIVTDQIDMSEVGGWGI